MPGQFSDQIAKEPSGSTPSTKPPAHHHAHHDGDKAKASVQDLQSKGPQITDDLPPAASKEELQAKARELNK